MITIGIDPGPDGCGWVEYDTGARRVVGCDPCVPLAEAIRRLREAPLCVVAIERWQAGCSSVAQSSIVTIEWAAVLAHVAREAGHDVRWLYRRQVLTELDATGPGSRDALVRARLLEMHGGPGAVGTKRAPGPLYGMRAHCWPALGVLAAALTMIGREWGRHD